MLKKLNILLELRNFQELNTLDRISVIIGIVGILVAIFLYIDVERTKNNSQR